MSASARRSGLGFHRGNLPRPRVVRSSSINRSKASRKSRRFFAARSYASARTAQIVPGGWTGYIVGNATAISPGQAPAQWVDGLPSPRPGTARPCVGAFDYVPSTLCSRHNGEMTRSTCLPGQSVRRCPRAMARSGHLSSPRPFRASPVLRGTPSHTPSTYRTSGCCEDRSPPFRRQNTTGSLRYPSRHTNAATRPIRSARARLTLSHRGEGPDDPMTVRGLLHM